MAEKSPITVLFGPQGYNDTIAPHMLKPNLLAGVKNVAFRYDTIRRRPGNRLLQWAQTVSAIGWTVLPYGINTTGSTWVYGAVVSDGANLKKIANLSVSDLSSGHGAKVWRGMVYDSADLFMVNGSDKPRVFEGGSTIRQMGIERPTVAPTLSAKGETGGTVDVDTSWYYKYKYWDQDALIRSRASDVSAVITAASATHVEVALTDGPQSNAPWKRIYRTEDGGTSYYYITAVSGTSYDDSTPDAALILNDPIELTTAGNDLEGLPPVAQFVTEVPGLKRVFMAGYGAANGVYGSAARGTLYWSEEGQPEYFLSTNVEELGFKITALAPIDDRLLVFSPDAVHTLALAGNDTIIEVARDEYHGCNAPATVASCPYGVLFLDAKRKEVCLSNGSRGIGLASAQIRKTLARTTDAYLATYAAGEYYPEWNEYWLAVPVGGDAYPSEILVLNLAHYPSRVTWTRYTNMHAHALAMCRGVVDDTAKSYMVYGDDKGRFHQADVGLNDDCGTVGASADGYSGDVMTALSTSLYNSAAAFPTSGIGLEGDYVHIISGTGSGQQRRIDSNTGDTITLTVGQMWTTVPDTTSKYSVGSIPLQVKSRAIGLGRPTRQKKSMGADVIMRNDY